MFGCSNKSDQTTTQNPEKPAEKIIKQKETEVPKQSVSTPPLDLATTKESTGINLPTSNGETEKKPEDVTFDPREIKTHTNVIILFDASGSMSGQIESDSKLSYVRNVIKDLIVQPAPGGMHRSIGIMAYGAKFPIADQQCTDLTKIAPLGQIKMDQIAPDLDAIVPQGSSPITYAIQEAAKEFPNGGENTDNMIILLADGGDSCGADPCVAARQIHAENTKTMIHVIGFDLDKEAEKQLRCVAEVSDGRFFLARNIPELRSSADQAMSANLPYNLRIKVFAGATPLPTTMTVYRSGTRRIVEQGQSSGIKFLQLAPGSYDILITYDESIQEPKPSKLLNGVEVQASARAEQVVYFDLGTLELDGIDPSGKPVSLTYNIFKKDEPQAFAKVEGKETPVKIVLSPDTYKIIANGPTINNIPLTATVPELQINSGETINKSFRFQTGEVKVKTALGDTEEGVPSKYNIYGTETDAPPLASGEISQQGTDITLPVGTYVITLEPHQKHLQGHFPIILENVEITADEKIERLVRFPVGKLKLLGKESDGTTTKTEFQIRNIGDKEVINRTTTINESSILPIAPGSYQITAVRIGGKLTPPPTIVWEEVEVVDGKTIDKEAVFQLGTLKLSSRDAKEQPLTTEFTIFRPGHEAPLVSKRTNGDPIEFKLTPGFYDVRAQDESATGNVRPTIWMHEIAITANGTTDKRIVFTSGRVRLTCRTANNKPIPCQFRIFTYGQDAPLYSGETTENWREFEMEPGYYYLEVGYNDVDVVLKKWINISVDENSTVEEVIRF